MAIKPTNGIFLFLAIFTACSIRIIAPYDTVTDSKVNELQEVTLLQFNKWKKSDDIEDIDTCSDFYNQIETSLDILIARNEAIEDSKIIVEMLGRIRDNIEIIKQEHEAGRLTPAFIEEIYDDINSQFTAVQKFQMALKRAEE